MKVFLEKGIECNVNIMRSVVADVESYPKFINLCKNVITLDKSDDGRVYDIDVGYGIISSKVVCRVLISGDDIIFSGESKILDHMKGMWSIVGNETRTNASFELDITFKNPILNKLFESKKQMLSYYIVDLFVSRAMKININI
jgi:ribosome-associated toxin RatA of RatAB toxin-antitoxin module